MGSPTMDAKRRYTSTCCPYPKRASSVTPQLELNELNGGGSKSDVKVFCLELSPEYRQDCHRHDLAGLEDVVEIVPWSR